MTRLSFLKKFYWVLLPLGTIGVALSGRPAALYRCEILWLPSLGAAGLIDPQFSEVTLPHLHIRLSRSRPEYKGVEASSVRQETAPRSVMTVSRDRLAAFEYSRLLEKEIVERDRLLFDHLLDARSPREKKLFKRGEVLLSPKDQMDCPDVSVIFRSAPWIVVISGILASMTLTIWVTGKGKRR